MIRSADAEDKTKVGGQANVAHIRQSRPDSGLVCTGVPRSYGNAPLPLPAGWTSFLIRSAVRVRDPATHPQGYEPATGYEPHFGLS